MNGARGRVKYIVFAFLAAVFYAVNIPFSKLLLERIDPTVMAALLYLGAGIGVGIMSLFMRGDRARYEKLGRSDLPYVIGMIALDIFAPILLMFGLKYGTSSSASLLGNFEIAATAVIALIFFKEAVSKRLWLAIALITLEVRYFRLTARKVFISPWVLCSYCLLPYAGALKTTAPAGSPPKAHTRSWY